MRHAMGAVHAHPPRLARLDELLTETALPHPRLAHDPDHLAGALGGSGEGRLEGGHLLRPAHEPGEASRPRHLVGGSQGADALEDGHAHRLPCPFDGEGP